MCQVSIVIFLLSTKIITYYIQNQKKWFQIYFPIRGRSLREPSMVLDESLFNKLLEKKSYEFILDKACIQYEPDEPQFHHMTAKVYQYCNQHAEYEPLRLTIHRHYFFKRI